LYGLGRLPDDGEHGAFDRLRDPGVRAGRGRPERLREGWTINLGAAFQTAG
jgi:hypothetical protein